MPLIHQPFPIPPFRNPPLLGVSNDDSSTPQAGVTGQGGTNSGVVGASTGAEGVQGSTEAPDKNAIVGRNMSNGALGSLGGRDPIFGQRAGVYGQSDQQGIMGLSTGDAGTGVYGGNTKESTRGIGVRGETFGGVGVQGTSFGTGLAGRFVGDVEVTGDLRLANRDLAEQFEVDSRQPCEAGMVMVIGERGALSPCQEAYDRRAVGVISGAGSLRPAITLGATGPHAANPAVSIALAGTAFCLVDADFGAILPGDLITSSKTAGHAMKADDPTRSFGSIVGKALAPLPLGRGLVPILIALQ